MISLIPRASEPGLQLLEELMLWDSERRPSAQQALKYTFFQITKRGSDPIHMPSSLLAKHQQQQQLHGRSQNFIDDHVSHISLDDAEKYVKDNAMSYRHFDQFNSVYRHANGVKQPIINGNQSTKQNPDYLTDTELSPKRTKPENGINTSLFNGDLNFTPSLNNNYQSEVSADDAASEENFRKNPFATNTSDTGFSSTVIRRNSHNSITQLHHNNSNNDTSTLVNGNKGIFNHIKANEYRKEPINGIAQRRNSRFSEQNMLLNEKISDIYVNRNLGKLYDNRGSIYNNKLYNGNEFNENNTNRQPDFPHKNNTFFLHDNHSTHYNDNKESKIYNIFSKQRLIQPRQFEPLTNDDDEENSYLVVKMTSATKKQPKKSISIMHEKHDSFEDEELDKLLGYKTTMHL